MQWFRFYHEALEDPKVQLLPPRLFKAWVNILCAASVNNPRGTLPLTSDLAFLMRIDERRCTRICAELVKRGLLDRDDDGTLRPHNWQGRQPNSDDVALRVRRHRNVTSVVTETPGVTDFPSAAVTVTLAEEKQSTEEVNAESTNVLSGADAPSPRVRALRESALDDLNRASGDPQETAAVLQSLSAQLHGTIMPPGLLMKWAKDLGGAKRLVPVLIETASHEVLGDRVRYIAKAVSQRAERSGATWDKKRSASRSPPAGVRSKPMTVEEQRWDELVALRKGLYERFDGDIPGEIEEADDVGTCSVCGAPCVWAVGGVLYCTVHVPAPLPLSADEIRALGALTPEKVGAIGPHVVVGEPDDVPF